MPLSRTPPVRRLALALLAAASASAAAVQPQTKENNYAPPGWNPAADYNATLAAIPAEDKAYLELTRIDLALRAAGLPEDLSPRPGDDAWPALAAWLERDEVRALLADLRAAAARPHLGWPLSDGYPDDFVALHDAAGVPIERPTASHNPVLLHSSLPMLRPLRAQARLLAADTALATITADSETAVSSVVAMLSLANFTIQPKAMHSQLFWFDTIRAPTREILRTLHAGPNLLANEQLALLAAELEQQTPLAIDTSFELLCAEDALRRIARPDGTWGPDAIRRIRPVLHSAPPKPHDVPNGEDLASAAWPVDRVLSERAGLLQRVVDESATPWSGRLTPALDHYNQLIMDLWAMDNIPGWVLGSLDPAWYKLLIRLVPANTELSATRLAVAFHRHKLRHGEFPATLADLDADLLASPPIDFHTGEPLLYALRAGTPVIASAGNDRDDDGFRPALNPDGTPAAPAWIPLRDDGTVDIADPGFLDGDWILFPPAD